MATVSNFGVSFCVILTLFTVVEADSDGSSYLDAWWFIWMTVLMCLICGCGGGASYYKRRVWQQQQLATVDRYEPRRYPVVYPGTCDRNLQEPVYVVGMASGLAYVIPQRDVTNGSPDPLASMPPMREPTKPPPYEPRSEDNTASAPPAYQEAIQMPQPQTSEQQQLH